MKTRYRLVLGLWISLSVAGGCRPKPAEDSRSEPPVVSVSLPVVRSVRDYADFNGQTDAIESVVIQARVTGYLTKVAFSDGAEVRKGDLLYQIDARPFQAQYEQALADIKVQQANLTQQQAELARGKVMLPKAAMSQEDFERVVARYGEAVASLAAAEAKAALAKINLDFATIVSPIAGRISRTNITAGNVVNADVTKLTTVVSQDPMYVYFDVDEHTMLRVIRMELGSPQNLLRNKKIQVLMAVADEEGFPHSGYLDFANNVVDKNTGTVTARGVFANPAGPYGVRLLRPGMFLRVRLPLGTPQQATLVAERAIGTDQGNKYVLTVDDQRAVHYRRVSLGPLEEDGLRVIRSGLRANERVIVSGLQLVQPKMTVEAEEVPMPVVPAADAGRAQPGGATPSRPQS
jgi:membrane fusion protein, multidrug efflux system